MHFCVVRHENVLFCDGVNPKEGFGVASAMQAPVGLATERAVPALLAGGHCFGRQAAGAWRSHKRRTPSLSALAPQLLPSGNIQRRARQNLHRARSRPCGSGIFWRSPRLSGHGPRCAGTGGCGRRPRPAFGRRLQCCGRCPVRGLSLLINRRLRHMAPAGPRSRAK